LHDRWLLGAQPRLFDLVVSEWQPTGVPTGGDGVTVVSAPGPRNDGYARYFAQNPQIFDQYASIALIDDDVLIDTDGINACFTLGEDHGLELWQPSLTWDSYFSYAFTLHNPLFELRFCNFVEMMCPFFSSRLLRLAAPTFSLGYLVGIDTLWTRLLEDGALKYAVIDAVSATHTRPIGLNKALHGFAGGSGYAQEIGDLLGRLGLEFRGPVIYAGVSKRGRRVSNRPLLSAAVSALAPALAAARNRRFMLARLADHARHILTRPINNAPIPLASIEALRAERQSSPAVAD